MPNPPDELLERLAAMPLSEADARILKAMEGLRGQMGARLGALRHLRALRIQAEVDKDRTPAEVAEELGVVRSTVDELLRLARGSAPTPDPHAAEARRLLADLARHERRAQDTRERLAALGITAVDNRGGT